MKYEKSAAWAVMEGRNVHNPPDGHLLVQCWCGRRIIAVPAWKIRAMLTDTCGHPWCKRRDMTPETERVFQQVTAGLPATVRVTVEQLGTWAVPRRWIAEHGLKATDVPALAALHGWEKLRDV